MRKAGNVLCLFVSCLLVFAGLAFATVTNLVVESGKDYEVIEDGLAVGGLVYIDRPYVFVDVPIFLRGATYIKTANNDKGSRGSSFLSFDVDQDATVYVGRDIRIPEIPVWLLNFTDTGDEVVTSDTTFRLFAKTFSAGAVTLGGNRDYGGDYRYSMYTVIVVGRGIDDVPPAPPSGMKIIELRIEHIVNL